MAPLAGIAVATSVAGSIAGGVASISQGRAQARAARSVGEFNAQTAELEGAIEEDRLRRSQNRTLARLRASIAGRGVMLEGTPLDVLADQVAEAEENAILVRLRTERRAQAIRFGSSAEASFAAGAGLAQGIAQFGQAGGSLLTGIAEFG